jgi:hypothetical protein
MVLSVGFEGTGRTGLDDRDPGAVALPVDVREGGFV